MSKEQTVASVPSGEIDLREQWQYVLGTLRRELGEAYYEAWLCSLNFEGLDGGVVSLSASSRFKRDWVRVHCSDRIAECWKALNSSVRKIDLTARQADAVPLQATAGGGSSSSSSDGGKSVASQLRSGKGSADGGFGDGGRPGPGTGDSGLGAPLDPRFTFENFVVGKSNEFAYSAARGLVATESPRYNPLFLYSGVGLGKTHLMHAIAWEIRSRQPERQVLYLSAEKFMYQFIKALRGKDTISFKEALRSVDVLMVDDVQFIGGKGSTQDEFFHTFNALVDNQKQLVISADRSPSALDGIEDRVRSRLGSGLVADIHPTDFELRLGILQSKADMARQDYPDVEVSPTVLEFLAGNIPSNVRELEGGLTRLVAFSALTGRPITIEVIKEVLEDLLRASTRKITIDDVQRAAADYFNVRLADMLSARRARAIARPRQVAMYLSKQLTSRSLPEIGRKFGGRDHTTVIHAVRRIEELRGTDSALNHDVENLQRLLQS